MPVQCVATPQQCPVQHAAVAAHSPLHCHLLPLAILNLPCAFYLVTCPPLALPLLYPPHD